MLHREQAALVVVDVQGKLARMVHESERVVGAIGRAIRGAKALDIPVIVTEQYPEGIGPTIEELASLVPDVPRISKKTFSCCGAPSFLAALGPRSQVVLTGIETHVCVYQTCRDLLLRRFQVHVAADAVSSRDPLAAAVALDRMRAEGAVITTVEMALFEMLEVAEGDRFRAVLRVVK